jgi:Mrp family chromosome partitioning ATPase
MSRNFELLQKLGKDNDIFQPDLKPVATARTVDVEEPQPISVDPTPLQLEMDEAQKDELTKLVQRLFLTPAADAARVIIVAGTEAGSGCSWICARIAEVLASKVTSSVCVVDANLSSPGLHNQFHVENHHGLADALRHPGPVRSFATHVSRKNLWLLSCGADSTNWQSLISSERMRMRIAELRAEFDYVLIDAPAMQTSNDCMVLGAAAEGVVVVIKANSSRRETARKLIQEVQSANVRVLGAVLNQRTFPIPQSVYELL